MSMSVMTISMQFLRNMVISTYIIDTFAILKLQNCWRLFNYSGSGVAVTHTHKNIAATIWLTVETPTSHYIYTRTFRCKLLHLLYSRVNLTNWFVGPINTIFNFRKEKPLVATKICPKFFIHIQIIKIVTKHFTLPKSQNECKRKGSSIRVFECRTPECYGAFA